jgi:hypothetical protein
MTHVTLKTEDVAAIGQALLTLTKELWIVKDRQAVLETVLEEQGIAVKERVRTLVPDDGLEAELRAERQRLVSAVLDSLASAGGAEASARRFVEAPQD